MSLQPVSIPLDQLCAVRLLIFLASKYDTLLTFHDEYRAASAQDYEGAVSGVWDLLLNYYFNQKDGFVHRTQDKVEGGYMVSQHPWRHPQYGIIAVGRYAEFYKWNAAASAPAIYAGRYDILRDSADVHERLMEIRAERLAGR
ncbi:uncharacterized protein P174DRAFT_420686 [Aspergillus novofumigatus IBT 16806]|uniref:Uncharacterized protein n=1 Tax=Aspergillus novofumigatus (strain IBT 16806) TaxID=1392255 RepID=A0A2I1C948_ASPN1|nr:uncharacterized protein P174DRAFT_420686 [Aspergillus novofumigatus IBT 16806]PKX94126.1 hypothetical protein P174DRAFT_420686 [Aspergillus novofumigatus IBT 16806]